jgi:glucan phosphoethanolaminetransferase (alkaline phosphatase superfamily)
MVNFVRRILSFHGGRISAREDTSDIDLRPYRPALGQRHVNDMAKALLLFFWLLLPNLIAANDTQITSGMEAMSVIALSIVLFSCPLIFISKLRLYFFVLTPIAFLTPLYSYLILVYHCMPGDALISAALHTGLMQAIEVALSFGWVLWLLPVCGAIYVFLANSISNETILSMSARKTLLAGVLMYFMVGLGAREIVSFYVKTPPFIEKSTADLSFPASLCMSISRLLEHREVPPEASVHGALPLDAAPSEIVVLVIGESVRSDHLGINGYSRNTTPYLSHIGSELISFPDVASTANWTDGAVPNIVSPRIGKDRISLIQTFREAGFRTAWFSNQERSSYAARAEFSDFHNDGLDVHFRKDMDMLPLFHSFVQQAGPRQFIVLHMYGSHVPYDERYTAESKIFGPTLSDINVSTPRVDHKREAINSYDNSIVELDRFLHRVIQTLEVTSVPAVMLYTSDHGENLFDDERERFMHAIQPPTRFDTHVPLLVWANKTFKKTRSKPYSSLITNRNKKVSHNNIFPTVLDLAGIEWDARVVPEKGSIASDSFVETKRMIFSSLDPAKRFDYDSLH